MLNAFGSFTLPLIASLFPLIDGEEVDQVMLAANYGESATVALVTRSGRHVPVEQLPFTDQLTLAAILAASQSGP